MGECKHEFQDIVEKDRRHWANTMLAAKKALDCSDGTQCSEDAVIPALREIGRTFEAEGSRVWIHVEANRSWVTIGDGDKLHSPEEHASRLKYQVQVSGRKMKSRLYMMTDSRPYNELPIGDERVIAGDSKTKSIADITDQDIVNDFMEAFERYVHRQVK